MSSLKSNLLLQNNKFLTQIVILVALFFSITISGQSTTISGNTCTITGTVSTLTCASLTGVKTINIGDGSTASTLDLTNGLDLSCLGAIQINVTNNSNISVKNKDLVVAAGSAFLFTGNGTMFNTNGCNASGQIYVGTQVIASCNGSGATFSFATLVANGCSVSMPTTATATPASTTICVNSLMTSITHNTTNTTGIGTATGLPAGVTATWANNKITISGTPTASGTFAYNIPLIGGCGTVSATGTITVTPTVGTPVFSLGSTSSRCVAGAKVTYTAIATNSTAVTYSLDATSASKCIINTATGEVTFGTALYGTTIITATAVGCGVTKTATHTVTTNLLPAPPTATVTQPTATSKGTVVLNNLPGSWTINETGAVTSTTSGTGSSSTFSALNPGTYNFTVTNSVSCASPNLTVVLKAVVTNNKTWYGTTSTSWFDASNWYPAGVPDITSDVIITASTNSFSIAGTNTVAYANTLTVASGGRLDISSTITVNDAVNVATGGTLNLLNGANLIQVNNVANTGSIAVNRTSAPMVLYDYTYWSSPTSGSQTLSNFSPDSNQKYFLTFENKWFYNNAANTFNTGTTNVINPGVGVAMLSPNGITKNPANAVKKSYVFTGTPNNGDINVPVTYANASSRKLVGNPYPSALDVEKFIIANLGTIDGTLYFWTHNSSLANGAYSSDDYAMTNLSGTTPNNFNDNGHANGATPTNYIASCQGFMVKPIKTGTVAFTNDMRVGVGALSTNNGNFYKTVNGTASTGLEKHRIWLNLTNSDNTKKSQALVGYIEKATNDLDLGFDGAFTSSTKTSLYSLIGTDAYTIQARTLPFTSSDIVPLGFKADTAGDLTISIDTVDGLFSTGQDVLLEDKLTNTTHNLSTSGYTFSTAAGTFNDRFNLKYAPADVLAVDTFDQTANNVSISSQNQQIRIKCDADSIDKVFVYDLLGREIYKTANVNSNDTLISGLTDQQIVIVKVVLANGQSVSKKVIY